MGRRLILVLALLFPISAAEADRTELDDVLREARRGEGAYERPGVVRGLLESALFRALIACARRNDVGSLTLLDGPASWIGFRVILTADGGDAVAVIVEQRRRGAGVYALRVGPRANELFVQAPHAHSDLGSAPIAIELWRRAGARALALSTVHRNAAEGSDVAHEENSTFQRVTRAWLAGRSGGAVVQIHGFADTTARVDMVLSAGVRSTPPRWLGAAKRRLQRALPGARVALYPDDVRVLGGRTNVQGKAARREGARFLHVELSARLRARIRERTAIRQAVLDALLRTVTTQE